MQNANAIVTVATAMIVPLSRFKIKLQFSQKTGNNWTQRLRCAAAARQRV